jgi:hypothetical protein
VYREPKAPQHLVRADSGFTTSEYARSHFEQINAVMSGVGGVSMTNVAKIQSRQVFIP